MTRDEYLPEDWTPLQRAAHATVHDYRRGTRRGAAALAPLVGKSPATISNEVNPAMDHHKLGVEDAILYQHLCSDYRIMRAMAMELGGVFVGLPPMAVVGDKEVLTQFSAWQAALGRTAQAIHDALEDARVDAAELEKVKSRFHDHIAEGLAFLHRLEAIAEKS